MKGKNINYVSNKQLDYLHILHWKMQELVLDENNEDEYRILSDALVHKGFKYDPQNDTLVFMFYH